MLLSEILAKARLLIENPANWSHDDARWGTGGVECSVSAVGRVMWENRREAPYGDPLWPLGEAIGDASIVEWNDAPERTHAEVLAAFDRAIEIAKQAEAGAA